MWKAKFFFGKLFIGTFFSIFMKFDLKLSSNFMQIKMFDSFFYLNSFSLVWAKKMCFDVMCGCSQKEGFRA